MKNLLRKAREEIFSLRRRNEILQAKVDMIELFERVLNTQVVYPTQGMGEDVAWRIEREIEQLDKEDLIRAK